MTVVCMPMRCAVVVILLVPLLFLKACSLVYRSTVSSDEKKAKCRVKANVVLSPFQLSLLHEERRENEDF